MRRNIKDYLTDKPLFWIVHARLSADSVQGLDTILSGSYIAMNPSKEGAKMRKFKGLEEPPIVVDLSNGIRLVLEAKDRGSIQVGSPIYYKKIKAGTVLGYKLSKDSKKVYTQIFLLRNHSQI